MGWTRSVANAREVVDRDSGVGPHKTVVEWYLREEVGYRMHPANEAFNSSFDACACDHGHCAVRRSSIQKVWQIGRSWLLTRSFVEGELGDRHREICVQGGISAEVGWI